MFRIMSLNKYQALTRYVIELEEKCKVLKEFNANMEREIKRLEEKIKDYESNGVKIKAAEKDRNVNKEKPFWATERCFRCGEKIDNSKGYPTYCPKCHTSFLD